MTRARPTRSRVAGVTFPRAAIAFLFVVLGCLPAPSQVSPKKTGTMNNAVIATFPTEPAVLSGQSLIVRTVFDNRGSEPIATPRRTASSQFAYMLRSKEPGGPTYPLSQDATFRRQSPDLIRKDEPALEQLPGGKQFERLEDIAKLWNDGFQPGEYWLTVQYPREKLDSPRAEVTILPLVAEAMSSFVSLDHLSSVAAHRHADGQVTLLHRESMVRDPREGVFYARHVLPPGGPVSVATSIDVAPAGNGRWFAWLRDGKLNATNAWGDRVTKTADPLDAVGELLSPGFQIGVGTAMFGTVSPDGRLETFIASPDGLKKGWSAELGSAATNPRWNGQADGSVTVAWEETNSGRIMRRSFGADGQPRDAAPQAATPGRPLTWGLPVTGAPTIWVVVLDGAIPVFARLPVGAERALTRLPELTGATEWAFFRTSSRSAVVALANDKLYASSLESPAWRVVSDAPKASRVNIISLDGRSSYVEWIEGGFGIRRARVP